MHRAELLDSLDDIGQLADPVLALVGRTLRGGREDAEREDVDKPKPVHAPHVDPLDASRSDLPRRFERFARHAQRPGEIVGRTRRNHPEGNIQPLALHGIDHVVDRAVTARHDHQVDRLVAVERIGTEIDQPGFDLVAVSPEDGANGLDASGGLAFARLRIIKKYSLFHISLLHNQSFHSR